MMYMIKENLLLSMIHECCSHAGFTRYLEAIQE